MNYELIPNNEIFFNNIITYLNMETLFDLLLINKYHNITIKNKILDYILLKISNFLKIEPNILKEILSKSHARISGSFLFSCFLDIFKKQTKLNYNENLNILICLSTVYKKGNKLLYNHIEDYKQNDKLAIVILSRGELGNRMFFKISRKRGLIIKNPQSIYSFGKNNNNMYRRNKPIYKTTQFTYLNSICNSIEINDDFLTKNKIIVPNKIKKEDIVIITPSNGTTLFKIAIISSIVIGFIYLINKSK